MDPSCFSYCVWYSFGAGRSRHESAWAYFRLEGSEEPCELRCSSSFDFQWALGARLSDSLADLSALSLPAFLSDEGSV